MAHVWKEAQPLTINSEVEALAATLRALSTSRRLRIVQALMGGPLQRHDLRLSLNHDPSSSLDALVQAGIVERLWEQGSGIRWKLTDGFLERLPHLFSHLDDSRAHTGTV